MSHQVDEGQHWSTAYLLARLELVRARVEAVVATRRRVDPKPDDPYKGVYTDDRDVDHLLSEAGESRGGRPLTLALPPNMPPFPTELPHCSRPGQGCGWTT